LPRFTLAVALPLFALASCGAEQPAQSDTMSPKGAAAGQVVSAMVRAHHGAGMGEVLIASGNDGLMVNVMAEGMKPGTYGVHIHTTGKCDGPDFKSAGGHWNPFAKAHGLESGGGAHAGDLPNLVIAEGGTGGLSFTVPHGTMDGEGGLMDADGAAFMIHAGPDDMKSDPAGNSGERIGCGVFEVRESVKN
jgi:superoxide dismutase, Cu-Zn family